MVDWRALEPLSAAGLMMMAKTAVRETRPLVDRNARLSHVGFRSQSLLEWENLMMEMAPLGQVFMTSKPDGRKIPFLKLSAPISVGADVLTYIELPAPKPVNVEEPAIVVSYQISGESREPMLKSGYDMREQSMHAEDFIARDAGKSVV